MLTKALILIAIGFAALGALRLAVSAPRPRWMVPAVIGIAVSALLWKWGVVGFAAGAVAGVLAWVVMGAVPALRPPTVSESEAEALLGLGPTASEEDIRAAHRRRIANAHPDKGGDAQLAARLNAARDLLLKTRKTRR